MAMDSSQLQLVLTESRSPALALVSILQTFLDIMIPVRLLFLLADTIPRNGTSEQPFQLDTPVMKNLADGRSHRVVDERPCTRF